MNRLLIRLWGVLESEELDSINHQIARTLVDNIASIKHTSTSALAQLCSVSKPTISRFSKILGYDDFYDFRAELNQYCPDRGTKYVFPESQKQFSYLSELRKNLELLEKPEFMSGVELLTDDIRHFARVSLMGNMQSGKTAANLHYNLHVIKKHIAAATGLKEQRQILEHIRPGDLIIIFSVSGEYFRALFSGGSIPERPAGSLIWMVTTNPAVKRMEGVDHILNTQTGSSLAGSNICLEMAANLIALRYWEQSRND